MEIINLTPHDITILSKESCINLEQDFRTKSWIADGAISLRALESSGVARVQITTQPGEMLDGIPTQIPVYGKIEGLPEYDKDKAYIVSLLTISAAISQGRTTKDLYSPGTIVRSRSDTSTILGCLDLNHQ
jgi:hypothetical protein